TSKGGRWPRSPTAWASRLRRRKPAPTGPASFCANASVSTWREKRLLSRWRRYGPSGGGAMTTALPDGDFDVLSEIDHRRELPSWMEDPGGQVLATLLGQAVQHGGARRGVLIVRRADEPRIEAEATTQPDTVVVRRLDTLPGPSDLPDTVLRYVLRTQETVMLEDAGARNPFSTDPYVVEH